MRPTLSSSRHTAFLPLSICLLMFPQFAQTLYSPAIADFTRAFSVAPEIASQALTVFFLFFALGVAGWGWACDRMGRRPAMLCGLALYAAACVMATLVASFSGLLVAQALAASGAAVGSVVTQTLLRDRYSGAELARIFSTVGMALAVSPAIGLYVGTWIVRQFGYKGTTLSLLALSMALLAWTAVSLPETRSRSAFPARSRPARTSTQASGSRGPLCLAMALDAAIWRSATLVAAFNVALYSYYALGPFIFERQHMSTSLYGYSGIALAMGSCMGAWLNKRLLTIGVPGASLTARAALLTLGAGLSLLFTQDTPWFLASMLVVVMAFGMAIPNVLGQALDAYRGRLGAAGAWFGLAYYLMIGAGMLLVGWTQTLAGTVVACGALATAACVGARRAARGRGIDGTTPRETGI
uniref:MFS transporter n=1 Tax=Bordetella sputigena TaxID=1416810 RepID=UPI0039F05EB2